MKNLVERLRIAVAADVPILFWGPPGVGKTAIITQEAQREGVDLAVIACGSAQPEDAAGIPVRTSGGSVEWVAPPWARRLHIALKEGRGGWLFIDEASCASEALRAAFLRVIQERQAGECDLTGCRIMAAANREDDAASGGWLDAASRGRWSHHDVAPDVEMWSAWAAGRSAEHAMVAAYLQRHPSEFMAGASERSEAQGGYPSPRGWDAAARLRAAGGRSPDVAGAVGQTAAAGYASWLAHADLPDPEDVLAGRAKLPERPDGRWAALGAVVHASAREAPDRAERLGRAWKILAKERADVALPHARTLSAADPTSALCESAEELADKLGRIQRAAR